MEKDLVIGLKPPLAILGSCIGAISPQVPKINQKGAGIEIFLNVMENILKIRILEYTEAL